MKLHTLAIVVFSLFFGADIKQTTQLPLLTYKENFKPEILNRLFKKWNNPSDVIMLRIHREDGQNNSKGENYELRLTWLHLKTFAFVHFVDDKYFGYFEYKGRTVLVYGDDGPGFFFEKSNFKKQFDFIANKPYDYEHSPPVSVEGDVLIYNFSDGEYSAPTSGMGFFH